MEQQIRALTDELNALKAEMINIKAGHAALHQKTVEASSSLTDQGNRIGMLESNGGSTGDKGKALIEPKQVQVPEFSGGMTDNRAVFIAWAEKERIVLCCTAKL